MDTDGGFAPTTPPPCHRQSRASLNENEDGRAGKDERQLTLTPSPTSVEGFPSAANSASANRPAIVSRLIAHHMNDIVDSDEEETVDLVLPSSNMVAIPDLDDLNLTTADIDADDESSSPAQTSSSDFMPPGTPEILTPKQTPEQVLQRKLLLQSVSSMVCGTETSLLGLNLNLGPERAVYFRENSLGIKISRHGDGFVRILSVTIKNDTNRIGDIFEGDLVREVSEVCLRKPIDSAEWNMTVGLIKMAPRPLKMILAREYDERDGNAMQYKDDDDRTRTVIFNERALGVKLHHNREGRVEILSVAALPIDRSGDVREGDLVLEAGGCDLRSSISKSSWLALVKYLREAPRPLHVVVERDHGTHGTIVTNKTNR